MSNNTNLDPEVALRVVADHKQTAGEFRNEQQRFNDIVDGMAATNYGRMIDATKSVRDEWVKAMSKVIANLDEMADLVAEAAGVLTNQDEDASQEVLSGGPIILSGL